MCAVKLDDTVIERCVRSSINLLNEYGYFTQCMWHVEDVHLLCQQRCWPDLSHQEAREVFDIFSELYDGDQGLTWTKLEQATQVYLAQHGKIKSAHSPNYMSLEDIEELISKASREEE